MMQWAQEELKTLDLGDARLDKRAVLLAEQLSQRPGVSIPQACGDWSQTQAAYRFFDNEDTDEGQVLQAHADASMQRMAQHPVVLCLQDTTELDFRGQTSEGLGPLSYEAQRGLYLHPTYAVTPEREPLGLVNSWNWARQFKPEGGGERGGVIESERWLEGYDRLVDLAEQLPSTKLVYVADRESDIMALFERAQKAEHVVDYLVRAQHNRVLPGKQADKLWAQAMAAPALGRIAFEMPSGRGRKARRVSQELRVQRVVLKEHDEAGKRIEVSCLIATEVDPPKGVKPVIWRLLSNRRADTLEQALELVQWYRARWEIELFFLVLKEGCRVERLQLGHVDRLYTALALYMVVAWRINRLMRLGRQLPDLPADLLFETQEWQAAYILNRKIPPKQVPGLNTVVRLVARLGGFLARKHDGEPGVKTLWLGMREIAVFVQGFRFAQSIDTCV
jgi:hypothetical protein